jgi:hypothetical protein
LQIASYYARVAPLDFKHRRCKIGARSPKWGLVGALFSDLLNPSVPLRGVEREQKEYERAKREYGLPVALVNVMNRDEDQRTPTGDTWPFGSLS